MSNISHRSRKTICCVFGAIFFCAFGAHATISSPDPDNAALLYYQAFLLRPELDDDTFIHFDSVLRGGEPDEVVREYLNLPKSRETIRIAEAATQILDCSWGIMRSQEFFNYELAHMTVMFQARQLAFLLEVDARTLAVDGEFRAALERCLSIRRLAQHFVDEATGGYLVSMPFHFQALRCIHYVLGSMPPDRNTLIWLQAQVSTVQETPPPPGRALEISLNYALKFLSVHPEHFAMWREYVSEQIVDESARQEILNLTDEELLEQVKESYNRFLSSVNRVIGSDMPYQQKYLELQELEEELGDLAVDDPVDILGLFVLSNVAKQHDIYIRGIANFNATRAAIEIYMVKAEAGQLPEILPAHLPKDPFSGQDFEYEATNQGFVLRCREKEIGIDKVWEYEFVIAQ